jgi:spoIIIJ-associated protein
MIKIEATTLQEAYSKASEELCCSITDLTFEVIQHPKKGIFGLFKKSAIIVASCKNEQLISLQESQKEQECQVKNEEPTPIKKEEPKESQKVVAQEPKEKKPQVKKEKKSNFGENKKKPKATKPVKTEQKECKNEYKESPKVNIKNDQKNIFDNFYSNQKSETDILYEIKADLDEMFKYSCFDIEAKNVEFFDDKTILIEFDGPDSALLIGKEGYRYKALSYMLFNWINAKYQLMIRLEIAEFLKNQEDMINSYLEPIKEKIKKDGNAKTKPLDGVLIHIALTKLRDEFPNKYVGVKSGHDGSKYIIINNFLSSNDK